MRPLVLALLLAGCTDEPGACVESVTVASVRYGWCLNVDSPAACPEAESSAESDEFKWRFESGQTCAGLDEGFDFDCGDGIFEDIESECPPNQSR